MQTATITDLKRRFGKIARLLEAGEIVDITRYGKVIYEVTPLKTKRS